MIKNKIVLYIVLVLVVNVFSKTKVSISSQIIDKDTITVKKRVYDDGDYSIDSLKNGELNGVCNNYYANGKIAQTNLFVNGKDEGVRKGWAPDGFLSVYKPYHNGIPIDTHTVYYDNKKLESIIIYDSTGEKNGWCRKWYENGNMQDSSLYTHGTKVDQYHFYENGKMMFTSTLREDGYILSSASWYPDGKPSGEIKNGNGHILLPSSSKSNELFDTLNVKDGMVQGSSYYMFHDK